MFSNKFIYFYIYKFYATDKIAIFPLLYIIFVNSKYGVVPENMLNTFYNELIEFGLTKTKLFGDDGTHTYDEKRDYYLYEYPKEFSKVAANNPDIFNKS